MSKNENIFVENFDKIDLRAHTVAQIINANELLNELRKMNMDTTMIEKQFYQISSAIQNDDYQHANEIAHDTLLRGLMLKQSYDGLGSDVNPSGYAKAGKIYDTLALENNIQSLDSSKVIPDKKQKSSNQKNRGRNNQKKDFRKKKYDIYRNVIKSVWKNGILTENEQAILEMLRRSLEVSSEEHHKLEVEFLKQFK